MLYVDVLWSVPTANKEVYRQHALTQRWFSRTIEHEPGLNAGATTCLMQVTSLPMAVK